MTGSAQELPISAELTGIAAVVAGIFVCLFGYRLLRVTTAIAGIAAGSAVGMALATELLHCSVSVKIALTAAAGLTGLLLALLLFRVGLFILGAGAGVLLTRMWQAGIGHSIPAWAYLAAGSATGLLVLFLQRALLILLTAFSGAGMTVAGAFQLLSRHQLPVPLMPLSLAAWILLGITGCIVQAAGDSRKAPP